jgi:hypothetical protein
MKSRRPRKFFSSSTWKRLLLALPISVLIHIVVAMIMRPDYKNVADFAVDFQVIEVTPGVPKQGETEPSSPPEQEKTPEPPPKPASSSKADQPKTAANSSNASPKTAPEPPPPVGIPDGSDAGVGSGICLHDLFAYTDDEPTWGLYISMASFRDTVFQREFGNTFRSFDLGRRLTRYMGMNPAEDVEALFVESRDVFDWRAFRIIASYDSGEERLMGQMTERLKTHPGFKWKAKDGGYVGTVPGEFKWQLMGSGRVFSIDYAPSIKNPAVGPAKDLPENPFVRDVGVPEAVSKGRSDFDKWPRQVPCISVSSDEKQTQKKKSKTASYPDISALSKAYLTPDDAGHFPVALLSTTDPRAVGIGVRLGKRLGFEHAVFRGFFSDPIRIEGILKFSGDEKGISALARGWAAEAKAYASDPILALAGVSHLLRNLTIESSGNTIRVTLPLSERQVLSSLLFLQLQGNALERQLKANQ